MQCDGSGGSRVMCTDVGWNGAWTLHHSRGVSVDGSRPSSRPVSALDGRCDAMLERVCM